VRALLGASQNTVWSQSKFVEKLQYMHMNPIKRKLVTHPKDWPWSSFSFYAKKEIGMVRIDSVHGWGREIKVKNPALEKTSRTGHPNFQFKARATRPNQRGKRIRWIRRKIVVDRVVGRVTASEL
jgi:hypothetical protein